MFFRNLKKGILTKISWLTCAQYGKNNTKKEPDQHSLVFNMLQQLLCYLNAKDPLIIPFIFVFFILL